MWLKSPWTPIKKRMIKKLMDSVWHRSIIESWFILDDTIDLFIRLVWFIIKICRTSDLKSHYSLPCDLFFLMDYYALCSNHVVHVWWHSVLKLLSKSARHASFYGEVTADWLRLHKQLIDSMFNARRRRNLSGRSSPLTYIDAASNRATSTANLRPQLRISSVS